MMKMVMIKNVWREDLRKANPDLLFGKPSPMLFGKPSTPLKDFRLQGRIQSEFHTGWPVWAPKKMSPPQKKVKLLHWSVYFEKLRLPLQQQMLKGDFWLLTLLSSKLRNASAPNSLDKLMQLILMEHYIYDLDSCEITDLGKFVKKPHCVVLSWCNWTIHI